ACGRSLARGRHHSPRPETVQHPARRERPAVRHRLRPGQADRGRQLRDPIGHGPRHAAVHGPRAGGRQPRRRPRRRRVRARREPALASRWAALAAFSGVVLSNHAMKDDPAVRALTIPMLILLAGWAAVSWLCQRGLRRPRLAEWATYAWSAADVAFLTAAQ